MMMQKKVAILSRGRGEGEGGQEYSPMKGSFSGGVSVLTIIITGNTNVFLLPF